jgi:Escherichia/Staphylococcus phage prohead protease
MQTKTRTFALDVKGLSGKGTFSGYLSVFDAIDAYREVVAPGAFTRTLEAWAAKGRMPPLLWQHRAGEPIGPFTKMEQDDKGLYVEAQLLVDDVQRAREAWALLKAKVISGMSIGFNVMPDGEEYDSRAGIVILKEVDLWEGSLATFPACAEAQVDSVKSRALIDRLRLARGTPTIREFEEALRDACAFSRNDAKAIAALVLGGSQRDADGQPMATDADALVREALKQMPKFNLSLEESRS